jgi:hypothetical protein
VPRGQRDGSLWPYSRFSRPDINITGCLNTIPVTQPLLAKHPLKFNRASEEHTLKQFFVLLFSYISNMNIYLWTQSLIFGTPACSYFNAKDKLEYTFQYCSIFSDYCLDEKTLVNIPVSITPWP